VADRTAGWVDDFGDPDRSPRAGVLARGAHLLPHAAIGYLAASVAYWLGYLPLAVWMPICWAASILIVVSTVHLALGRICLRCMEAVPADAPVRAQRRLWLLWFSHRFTGWRYYVTLLGILAAVLAFRLGLGLQPGTHRWTTAPADGFILATFWAGWIHHRYRPWCPYCRRWDDGGDREPAPDPQITGVRA
jgi:hypothetical protein